MTITLERREERIAFAIADDGVGFNVGRQSAGLGLLSMQDRIRVVGGDLEVDSSPGQGTIVHGTAPLGSVPSAAQPIPANPEPSHIAE